jgi:hypothetical protein
MNGDVGHLDVPQARRLGHGLRAGIVDVVAKDGNLAFARPGALEVGDPVLRACSRRGANNRQHQSEVSH